jgi:hypothetical protein
MKLTEEVINNILCRLMEQLDFIKRPKGTKRNGNY